MIKELIILKCFSLGLRKGVVEVLGELHKSLLIANTDTSDEFNI